MSQKTTLLIVDDSKVSRMMISGIVKVMQPEWELIEAENGEEALEKAEEQEIDYYSIDLNMPGIDGLEVITRLQSKFPSSPKVLMTANIQDDVLSRANTLGAACVHKPVTEESVSEMLEYFHA